MPENDRMSILCCGAHKTQHCILDRMENHPKCNKSDLKLYRRIVTGILGEAFDLICNSFRDGSSICKEKERLASAIATDKGPGTSILIPIYQLFNS